MNLHLLTAILAKLADVVAVFSFAEDQEATVFIGDIGGTYVEEARTVGEFYDIVDVGADADVFVCLLSTGFLGRVGDGDAWFWSVFVADCVG